MAAIQALDSIRVNCICSDVIETPLTLQYLVSVVHNECNFTGCWRLSRVGEREAIDFTGFV
ncbi:MAG: hypothetical protein NMNS01_27400 [Nitrosomonas sp.]|nr:MAG: hypothetical protein NMNS01_27400 [Nitrosomonas sp.]